MTDTRTLSSRRTILKGIGSLALLPGVGIGQALAASDTLRAGITGFSVINTLDPGKASLIPEYYVIWSVYNGLLTFDDKMKIVPDLAESYRTTDEGALEFKLRSGVKFHDGSILTAEDVKFSLERILDPQFASPNRSKMAEIDRIEILDPLTLRIYTKRPFAPLLTFLTNTRNRAGGSVKRPERTWSRTTRSPARPQSNPATRPVRWVTMGLESTGAATRASRSFAAAAPSASAASSASPARSHVELLAKPAQAAATNSAATAHPAQSGGSTGSEK